MGSFVERENEPLNDVVDLFNKIEGNVSNVVRRDNLKKLPKPLKYIGYFMASFLSISILLIILLSILN